MKIYVQYLSKGLVLEILGVFCYIAFIVGGGGGWESLDISCSYIKSLKAIYSGFMFA